MMTRSRSRAENRARGLAEPGDGRLRAPHIIHKDGLLAVLPHKIGIAFSAYIVELVPNDRDLTRISDADGDGFKAGRGHLISFHVNDLSTEGGTHMGAILGDGI